MTAVDPTFVPNTTLGNNLLDGLLLIQPLYQVPGTAQFTRDRDVIVADITVLDHPTMPDWLLTQYRTTRMTIRYARVVDQLQSLVDDTGQTELIGRLLRINRTDDTGGYFVLQPALVDDWHSYDAYLDAMEAQRDAGAE